METSLRFALTAALATLLLLILQPPVGFIAPSMFMLFLVSHETPYRCFKDLLTCLSGAALGTVAALLLMAATGAHPVARLVGLAVFTFLAAFLFRTMAIPALPMAFGCLTYMVISLWEYQIRDEKILHLSLWPMGTLATVAGSAIVVECLFNRSNPLVAVRREIAARGAALKRLFQLYAAHAAAEQITSQAALVRRYAETGGEQLHALLEQLSKDNACDPAELLDLKALNMALDRLLVLGAAFAILHDGDIVDPARCERIGCAIAAAGQRRFADVPVILGDIRNTDLGEMDRIEQTLRHLEDASVPSAVESEPKAPPAVPSSGSSMDSVRRLFLPDAFTNRAHANYALKLSLCATISYVIYNGLGWPGISTAFFTVYFTGLSTTGTTNRKLLLRVIGSTIGGVILGLGCLVFVFPNLEGMTGFVLVVAALAFLGSWMAASPYFGYLGFQTTFSFNLIAFERLRIPDQLTPARDRLLGIALGFLVMFLIFDQVRPERTVDTMRQMLARVLRAQAELMRLLESESIAQDRKVAKIRKQITTVVAMLQNFAHAVKFEFPPDREPDLRLSNEILSAINSAEDLLICVRTWPLELDGDQRPEYLNEIRGGLEGALRDLARLLEEVPEERGDARQFASELGQRLRSAAPASVTKAVDKLQELQMACEGIVRMAGAHS
jgi:multidrug resistance protein MdtO